MAEQSPSPFNLPPMVVVGLIVAAVGAFSINQRPFNDQRPFESQPLVYRHSSAEYQDVEARLWEDPLAAVAAARESDNKKAQIDRQACVEELLALNAFAASASTTTNTSAEQKSDTRASPDPSTMTCSLDDVRHFEQPLTHPLEFLSSAVNEVRGTPGKESGRLMIIGAMVSGAPYADDMETRRRTRYAVLSALYRSGYVPMNHEHIGYVTLPVSVSALQRPGESDKQDAAGDSDGETNFGESDKKSTVSSHDIAAFEMFESDAGVATPAHILLLWLDQEGFRKQPLMLFSTIANAIDPGKSANVSIIGPADSDGLRSIGAELVANFKKWKKPDDMCLKENGSPRGFRKIEIYSPSATADDEEIIDATEKSGQDESGISLAQHFHCWSPAIHLYRTVSSDKRVEQALWEQLRFRGVDDYNNLVLITERDSLYARLIGKYFGGCKNPPRNEPGGRMPDDDAGPHPLCMTYLRGLDGLTPPVQETHSLTAKSQQEGTASTSTRPASLLSAPESSSGPGQLDYLRRLALSLKVTQGASECASRSVSAASCGPRDIRAIGIIGNDVYDKLLILQALRAEFPRATFFTFGMEAKLFDAQSLEWTQNLLVGASVGLALRPKLQGDVPPFRDTYQATTYFSSVMAVHRAFSHQKLLFDSGDSKEVPNAGLGWTDHPRIFEIGRTRPYDLTSDSKFDDGCNLDGVCESIAASMATRNFAQSLAIAEIAIPLIASVVVFCFFWVAVGTEWLKMPVSITVGGGAWSISRYAITILMAVIIGCVLFFAWAPLLRAVTHDSRSIPASIFSGASPWASDIFELLSIIFVIALVVRGQRKLGDNAEKMRIEFGLPKSRFEMVAWSGEQIALWSRRARIREFFWLPFSRLSGYPGAALSSAEMSELETLLAQYLHRGRAIARFMRVFIVTVASTFLLYKLESIPALPLGGGIPRFDMASFEQWFGSSIALSCLIAMQFLVFWVADAVLLSRSFLLAVEHLCPKWPIEAMSKEQIKVNLPDEQATLWLNLQLVARRTEWVSNLIWYPSYVIAAMFVAAITVEFGRFRFADNPIALAISTSVIITAVWQLRRAAEAWRANAADALEDCRLRALGPGVAPSPTVQPTTQLDRLLDRVANLREGAFAPMSAQPIVRAVLLPLITYGATFLLQYGHSG